MRIIGTILAFLFTICAHGQMVTGSVIEAKTYEPVGDVLIANKRTGESVRSDSAGRYSINAIEGDLLLYYRLGFYTRRENARITRGELPMVALTQSNTLQEVEIKASTYQLDSLERSIIYRKPLNDANEKVEAHVGFGIAFSGLFGKLASILTGREKRVQRFKKQFISGEQEKFIATRYNIPFVMKVTKLSEEEAGTFINANPIPYDFVRAASELELQMWVHDRFVQYQDKAKEQH
ncbi:MAG: hypothetical protein JNL72_10560 [Flavipsychrobacter sp.]|nr:hypothetical protein [Flavipsychrobacter sp.]